jgi:transposase-like protein
MKERVKVIHGKEVICKYYSVKQIKEFVSEIEKDDLCIAEAAERFNTNARRIRTWLTQYSKTIEVKEKPRLPEEIKKTIVRDVQAGVTTAKEAAKKYSVREQTINNWLDKYSIKTPIGEKYIQKTDIELQNDKRSLKELEELKLKILALETMIDVAEKELNIDIRKKSGTKQSL